MQTIVIIDPVAWGSASLSATRLRCANTAKRIGVLFHGDSRGPKEHKTGVRIVPVNSMRPSPKYIGRFFNCIHYCRWHYAVRNQADPGCKQHVDGRTNQQEAEVIWQRLQRMIPHTLHAPPS